MSLIKNYNGALYKHLKIHAAWLPVVNTIRLGDYGLMDGGVFRTLGNIENLKVKFSQRVGQTAPIDFQSKGTTVARFIGDVKVDKLPEVGDVAARLVYSFSKGDSCLIRAALSVQVMADVDAVAKKLGQLDDWKTRFRVVCGVYTGEKCVILTTEEANTSVEFAGSASALTQIELGRVEIKPSISVSSESVFKSVGATGVVGLQLFKLNWKWFGGGAKFLAAPTKSKPRRSPAVCWPTRSNPLPVPDPVPVPVPE